MRNLIKSITALVVSCLSLAAILVFSPTQPTIASPMAVSSTVSCPTYVQQLSEIQLIWGPPHSIPTCVWVDFTSYRTSNTDMGWFYRCLSWQGDPMVTVNNVAICYNVPDFQPPVTATSEFHVGYNPIPLRGFVTVTQLQLVWGPPVTIFPGTPVRIMAYKANTADNAWQDYCNYTIRAEHLYVVYGIPYCTMLW